MTENINPLIGANTRETIENAVEALNAVIELMPEGSPIKITPKMETKMTLIYTKANIAHDLTCVRNTLEDEVIRDAATLQIATGRGPDDKLSKVAGLKFEEHNNEAIEQATD